MSQKLPKFISALLVLTGVLFIGNAGWPIVSYEIFSITQLHRVELLSPLPEGLVQGASTTRSIYSLDSQKASDWFIGAPNLPPVESKVKYYNISIPKLGIEDATVEISGDDLSANLIQYSGTALPGREGNTVVFGHSSLPQFFSPRDYLSIFTTLPSLRTGDMIFVDYDGIRYTYKVSDMFEVQPTDVGVLEQNTNGSRISLITCVPPGTVLRRLVVSAVLVPYGG